MATEPAPPAFARRLLYALHAGAAVLTVMLGATGLLVTFPDLRAALVGGWVLRVATLHHAAGASFLALLLASIIARASLRAALAARPAAWPWRWRRLHLDACLGLAATLAVTGVLLWADLDLAPRTLDALNQLHLAATWILLAYVLAHVAHTARRRARTRARLRSCVHRR